MRLNWLKPWPRRITAVLRKTLGNKQESAKRPAEILVHMRSIQDDPDIKHHGRNWEQNFYTGFYLFEKNSWWLRGKLV